MAVFRDRLAAAMKERGVSQAELSAMSSVPKSAINQYLSGKFKPKQTRTYILAETLGVDPAWLMGYSDGERELSPHELALIDTYRTHPNFRDKVDALLIDAQNPPTARVFRAAKSEGGTVAPAIEEISVERLLALDNAPETDEDL